ncbi:YdaU family protein [Acidithiobacillus sp. CV18-2]|nr:YdaU family protein [Acidithiobacillus sp. CV18-3]MBU2757505.1 YdaU family protein [Acidithiobacillus sp. BN09-2]MBU2777213.1 YdaU family protein [Acidithiobacillus sp. CV18-2]MBU2799938.1 YdaU family protein [Acidithiobacillus sp. VAN18-4]
MTSDQQLPDPPVPADCDLRQFPYMPLDITRLFNSDFHAITNAEEWRAGLTLWMKSFHQVPAASLPNDDVILCRLAELGRDLEAWKAIKERALHGWILCADGRLYHPVVAEKANEAWKSKQERTEKARDRANARWHPERTSERRRSRAHASALPEQCQSNATALPQHGLVREPSELESSARDCAKQGADSVPLYEEIVNRTTGYATALPEHCDGIASASHHSQTAPERSVCGASDLVGNESDCANNGTDSASFKEEKSGDSIYCDGHATALPKQCQSNAAAMLTETETDIYHQSPVSARARDGGDGSEKIPIPLDWRPSGDFAAIAKRAGIAAINGELEAAIAEFVSFWRANGAKRTIPYWDHAFLNNLLARKGKAPKNPEKPPSRHSGFADRDYHEGINPDGSF